MKHLIHRVPLAQLHRCTVSHRAEVQHSALCGVSTHSTDRMFSHHSGRWGICWSWLPRWCWGEAREVLFPGRGSAGKNETRRCVYKSTNTRRCTATQTPRGLRELIHNTFWNINCPQNIMQGGIMFASVMLHLLLSIKPLTELLCVILIPPLVEWQ